jgi:hypothetical protein
MTITPNFKTDERAVGDIADLGVRPDNVTGTPRIRAIRQVDSCRILWVNFFVGQLPIEAK